MNIITQQLEDFAPITLEEMDSVKLMNRTDTKFMIHYAQLSHLLSKAQTLYRVLEIEKIRLLPYSSIYFDTDEIAMYTMHHNQKLNRYKIRLRQYEQSGYSFLEIKVKNNKGRTSKKRTEITQTEFASLELKNERSEFIATLTPFDLEQLNPTLKNSFRRITLVDNNKTERVTIDLGLTFRGIKNTTIEEVSDLVIIEIKQEGGLKSQFTELLNEMRIKSGSMSKYCLGMAMIYPDIKQNAFKKKLRKINKLTTQEHVTN